MSRHHLIKDIKFDLNIEKDFEFSDYGRNYLGTITEERSKMVAVVVGDFDGEYFDINPAYEINIRDKYLNDINDYYISIGEDYKIKLLKKSS